jgi:cytochrome oxidase assembly protein ShyY1
MVLINRGKISQENNANMIETCLEVMMMVEGRVMTESQRSGVVKMSQLKPRNQAAIAEEAGGWFDSTFRGPAL